MTFPALTMGSSDSVFQMPNNQNSDNLENCVSTFNLTQLFVDSSREAATYLDNET